jgi:dienelactone hydrolase
MPRIERIDFTDADGVASFAHLIYPLHWRRGQRAPLVIVQYRWRGLLRAGTGDETPILPLSAQGYAVLSVDRPEFDARAATTPLDQLQRDLELEGLENAAKRRAIRFFIDEAIARGVADGARVGLTGMSDGAETVFDLITHDHYAAAIVSSPPLDPSAWSLNSARFRQSRARRLGMSAPWSDASPAWRDWWRTHNITDQTDRIETPILLNLAESEAIRAFPFIARMEETRTPLEAYIYPGAFHLKSRPSHLLAAQRRTMAWLDFWLRDIDASEDGDPTRAVRWAEMRARFEARRPLGSDVR